MFLDEPTSKVEMTVLLIIILLGAAIVVFAWMYFEKNPRDQADKPDLCDGIVDERAKNACYYNNANKTADHHFCLLMRGAYHSNRCLINLAVSRQNSTVCHIIRKDDVFEKSKCLYQVALKVNDSEICREIPQDHFATQCLDQVP